MNYYELLKIERDADASTVKRAYFSMVKIYSPDKDPEAFKAIRLAYETLIDQKKRSQYDSYFVSIEGSDHLADKWSDGELQNKLLVAREMIRENKFKQAEDYLTALIGTGHDSAEQPDLFPPEDKFPPMFYTEAKRLLAEVLWYMKKSGTAQKLCEQILKKSPNDADTLLLRAKIAVSMGHTEKADTYFNDAVNAAPLNARIWIAYMRYADKHAHYWVSGIFKRAMEQNIDMFRDDYLLYLIGLYRADLFSDKSSQKYFNKFADFFLADTNHGEGIYEALMIFIPHIIKCKENVPFIKKILPPFEKSRHRKDEDTEIFQAFHRTFKVYDLKSDKRIHEVLVDMTIFFLTKDTDKDELLGMECYIVANLSDLRPSIKILKNEYSEFFELNQAFYFDVLNEKKENHLIDKYAGKFKKIKPSSKTDYFYDDFDDDYSEDETTTFIRSTPKIGRNDPCPCGSGKKHKKCCGQ